MVEKFDLLIFDFVDRYLSSPLMDSFMNLVSCIAEGGIIWFIFAFFIYRKTKDKKVIIYLGIALIVNHIISSWILKNIFKRLRPFIQHSSLNSLAWITPSSFSCPSSHSSSSFCSVMILSEQHPKGKIIFIIMASLVAFSRLYLHVHYPSDIILGIITGIVVGFIANFCFKRKGFYEKNQL